MARALTRPRTGYFLALVVGQDTEHPEAAHAVSSCGRAWCAALEVHSGRGRARAEISWVSQM